MVDKLMYIPNNDDKINPSEDLNDQFKALKSISLKQLFAIQSF